MIAGIVAAQRVVAASVPATLWTPLNMATVPQLYLDAQDSVVTDVSGFCSAISNLGAMGSNGDFAQSTADRRPTILPAELSGNRVLRFDGTDDLLIGSTTAQRNLLTNVGSAWSFVVLKKRSLDASGVTNRILLNVPKSTSGTARFRVMLGDALAGRQNKPLISVTRLDADSAKVLASTTETTAYQMQLYSVGYSTGAGNIYLDGALSVTNPSLTSAGNTSNTASINGLSIGATDTGTLATDVDMAAFILSSTLPTAPEIDKLFGWAAHKYGLTANLPGGHPYKTVAPTV